MSEFEYDQERARLRELYGDNSAEAAAKRDQAMADLFRRSGWTQEKLAAKESKSQNWVSYRLRFGRFLNFITAVIKSESLPADLTEWRFRAYWNSVRGPEQERFRAIFKLIQEDPTRGVRAKRTKQDMPKTEAVRKALRPTVEAEKPIDRHRWAKKLDVSEATIQRAEMQERARLEGVRENFPENMVSVHELIEKLVPLLERVKAQAKCHVALVCQPELLLIASEGRRLLDMWASGDTTVRRAHGHVVSPKRPVEAKGEMP
jgi:hypothetical protein